MGRPQVIPARQPLSATEKRERTRLALFAPDGWQRPTVRAQCEAGPRPCPWVSCRHHLALDVTVDGAIVLSPLGEFDELPETCSLDVAKRGRHTLAQIAAVLGITRERARQIEEYVIARLFRGRQRLELHRVEDRYE